MSRIGKKPIAIPKGVKLEIDGSRVKVTGPKGSLEKEVRPEIDLVEQGGILKVVPKNESKQNWAFSGLFRSLVNNMVVGVAQGFQKKLVIEGVGYRAEVAGSILTLNVGYSSPVKFALPPSVKASIDKNMIIVESIDKELLGHTAAKIRAIRPPEPYKGKGIRYQDEHIVRKVGKSAGKK
ncbi:MAG: 50S ribosomal protein L6 [Desulfobacteraceae bacterium]|nr:50S ribosomal protein L6 [Desulfobacteraceae bacterium]